MEKLQKQFSEMTGRGHTMTEKQLKKARAEKQQTIKLNSLKNMAYIFAKMSLDVKGVYFCIIDGKKTEVIA